MALFDGMSPEEQKFLLANALMNGGAAMMGGRGNTAARISRGLAVGSNAYGSGAMNMQDAAMKKQQMMAQQQEYDLRAEERRGKLEASRAQQAVAQQAGGMFGGGPNLAQMGPGGPTPANAQAAAPASMAQQYRNAARVYAQSGYIEQAEKLNQIADKLETEYSTTPVSGLGPDGKEIYMQVGKRGEQRPLEGIAPAPKTSVVGLGNRSALINDATGAQIASYNAGQTPDSAARLRFDQGKYNDEKAQTGGAAGPKWDSASGQFVYAPDPQNPTGRAVTPAGATQKNDSNYTKARTGLENMNSALAEYKTAMKGVGRWDQFDPTKSTDIGSKHTALMLHGKTLFELGALAEADLNLMGKLIIDPTSARGRAMMMYDPSLLEKNAKQLQTIIDNGMKNLDRIHGKQPQQREDPLAIR